MSLTQTPLASDSALVPMSPPTIAGPVELAVVVVLFSLVFLLLALAIAHAKRDVSIDLTVLEIRK